MKQSHSYFIQANSYVKICFMVKGGYTMLQNSRPYQLTKCSRMMRDNSWLCRAELFLVWLLWSQRRRNNYTSAILFPLFYFRSSISAILFPLFICRSTLRDLLARIGQGSAPYTLKKAASMLSPRTKLKTLVFACLSVPSGAKHSNAHTRQLFSTPWSVG